jgi:hypothetical protein
VVWTRNGFVPVKHIERSEIKLQIAATFPLADIVAA